MVTSRMQAAPCALLNPCKHLCRVLPHHLPQLALLDEWRVSNLVRQPARSPAATTDERRAGTSKLGRAERAEVLRRSLSSIRVAPFGVVRCCCCC
jgi:hypothetical protein